MNAFNDLKKQFPALYQTAHGHPLIYLDNAATTQKPNGVINAINAYYQTDNANVHRAAHCLSARATNAFEAAREHACHFLNARSSDEIIWTRGATEAINLVAYSWGASQLSLGDEILLSVMEHHANIVPWQQVAHQTGAIIKVIDVNAKGELNMESFRHRLSSKTKLLAVTHMSNTLGTINPIGTLIKEAKSIGAAVLIDGAQAVAHAPVDVLALDCDFYVFSGHKMFGPTGIGVLYGKKALLEKMPPWQSGGEMINHVSFSGTSFNTLPFKFEAGTPNIAGAIGLAKAIEFVSQLDMNALAQREKVLRQKLEDGLKRINGVHIVGEAEQKIAVVSFTVDGVHHQDIGLLLDQQGIAVRTGHHCTMPLMERLSLTGTVRVSLAAYNTEDEINHFLTALAEVLSHYTPGSAQQTDETLHAAPPATHHDIAEIYHTMPGGKNGALCREEIEARLLESKVWQDKYRQIMLIGKRLPVLPESLKTPESQLQGCESRVWLHHAYDNNTMTLHFAADSDARIIRGLISMVLARVNSLTAEAIASIEINAWFRKLDLTNHLSPSRSNGLKAIVIEIQSIAHRYQ